MSTLKRRVEVLERKQQQQPTDPRVQALLAWRAKHAPTGAFVGLDPHNPYVIFLEIAETGQAESFLQEYNAALQEYNAAFS